LDDLGAENSTEWAWSTLYVVVNSRLEGGRKTVVTTNEAPSSIDHGSGRTASRLKAYARIALKGRDRRDRQAEEKDLFG
jgi:DNA replication protein DnaC